MITPLQSTLHCEEHTWWVKGYGEGVAPGGSNCFEREFKFSWRKDNAALSYLDRTSTRVAISWDLSLKLPSELTCLPTITSSMEPGLSGS